MLDDHIVCGCWSREVGRRPRPESSGAPRDTRIAVVALADVDVYRPDASPVDTAITN